MGAAIRRVDIEAGQVAYDSDMPMHALEAIMAASDSGNLTGLMEGLSEFVTEWPFEGDPSELDAWRNLRRTQFNAVTSAVVTDIGELGNE